MYEKLIQDLEADVRKHIRIQQQLKLHIEGVEDRVEELENENDSLIRQRDSLKKKFTRRLSEMDKSIKKLIEEK